IRCMTELRLLLACRDEKIPRAAADAVACLISRPHAIIPGKSTNRGTNEMVERLTRRKLLAAAGSVVTAASVAGTAARADASWPSKPIRVLMPFGAGGSMDILSRLLAPIVSESLGQQIVVENRPGATGTLAMAAVAAAPADGYTLMFTGSSYAVISLLMRNLPFSMDDFTPLSRLTIGPTLMAVPSQLGVKAIAEFVAAAKAQSG